MNSSRRLTRVIILLIVFLLVPLGVYPQITSVRGTLLDSKSKLPVIGAVIRMAKLPDTTDIVSTASEKSGAFGFTNLKIGSYRIQASRVGYTMITRRVSIDTLLYDLGTIELTESAVPMKEVVVEGAVPPALQKGDTTEFNAGAFKMNRDAVAEDLVAKMPGVTVENGTVKAQGEDVQRVLVDGKPFFGNDPTLAMRNLPADVIDKIQVFDKMSEQSEFTGFDDGRAVKTMNFVTRPERRKGTFGKTYGGYGDDGRYLAGGNLNSFEGEQRFSVLGLANNVNQQNFSSQDLLGATGGGGNRHGGFSGGGASNNFLVGQQNGITTTNSVGLNFADTWWSSLEVSQSYFFNYGGNRNDQNLHRQYLASLDTVTIYDEVSLSENKNYNHRYDGRFDFTIDTSQSLIVQPRLYVQDNRASSMLTGANSTSSQLINSARNNTGKVSTGNDLSNQVTYRYRFPQRGRTLSVDLRAGLTRKNGSGELRSLAAYYDSMGTTGDTLDQHSTAETDGVTLSSRLAYTEPLTDDGVLQFSYNPSYSKNNSDNRKFNFDGETQSYSALDTSLSNSYDNTYTTHNAGIGYRLRGAAYNAMVDVAYQIASLHGEQTYPVRSMTDKTFHTILPSVMLNIRPSEQSNLRLFYRTSTREPSINQLQDVVDNSNPLLLSTGNANLKPSYNQTLVARFSLTGAERGRSFFLLVSAGSTSEYIGNATIVADRDTMLAGGLTLNRGAQLTFPVNLDGFRNARTFLTYGLPIDFLQSNLNFNTGVSYACTPGTINDALNTSSSYTMSAGVVIGSNISEDLDFTLSYSGNYNVARNSAQLQLDNEYYTHAAGIKINWTFWQGIVFRNEFTNTLYNGSTGNLHERSSLWNINLGKKFLADDRAELRMSVTDLLNQNQSVNRSVTETYIEDSRNNVLGRYYMILLTYMVR